MLCALVALALLAALVLAAATLIHIPWLSNLAVQMTGAFAWAPLALAIALFITAFAALAFFIGILAWPSGKKVYTIPTQNGKLEISRQSIESGACITLQGFHEVKRYSVYAKGRPSPHKLKLDVNADIKADADLADLAKRIQTSVSQDMENSLGIKPGHVKVKINLYDPAKMDNKQMRKTGIPRVT